MKSELTQEVLAEDHSEQLVRQYSKATHLKCLVYICLYFTGLENVASFYYNSAANNECMLHTCIQTHTRTHRFFLH